MNHRVRLQTLAFLALPVLLVIGVESRDGSTELSLAQSAQAIIGAPLSPVSVGGVARRTTRRTVAYSSAASASASSAAAADAAAAEAAAADAQASAASAASAAAQPQPAPASLPAGTVVSALPQGCSSMTIDGGSYFNCAGTVYKPTFQSNNLVYVAQ